MSLLGKYPCENVTASTYLSFSTASVSVLVAIVATVGNSVLVLAILIDPNKNLRSSFNYFLASLGCADLVVGLLSAPVSSVYHFSEGLKHPSHVDMRVFLHMTFFIPCTASLLSLTALAIDRYLAIAYPLFYRAKLNPFRAFLVSVVVWIISILLKMAYFVVGYDVYRFVFANTAIGVTFVVLIFTYSKIFQYLRHQVVQWDDLHDSSQENLAKKQAMKWEKKMTKTLVIVLTLFLGFYLPPCICIYIINFCTACDCVFIHWVRDIQFVLVMANSGVNPFVYAWRLQNFRDAFKVILNCHSCLRRLRSISLDLASFAMSSSAGQNVPSCDHTTVEDCDKSDHQRGESNQMTIDERV